MAESAPALVACGLCVQRGRREVVRDTSFELRYGEILAVLGPNGAGKSTLLRAVSGLIEKSVAPSSRDPAARYSGRVLLTGVPLEDLPARERAARLAFVPQSPALAAPMSVRDVVAQGRYVHGAGLRAVRATDSAAIDQALQQSDVSALASRAFTELSRGEQQRVILARALCSGAKVLCLDEPTAALDVGHTLVFYELLLALRSQGYAICVVLHQLGDALRYADRAILMSAVHPARIGAVHDVLRQEHVGPVYGVHMRAGAGLEFDLIVSAGERA